MLGWRKSLKCSQTIPQSPRYFLSITKKTLPTNLNCSAACGSWTKWLFAWAYADRINRVITHIVSPFLKFVHTMSSILALHINPSTSREHSFKMHTRILPLEHSRTKWSQTWLLVCCFFMTARQSSSKKKKLHTVVIKCACTDYYNSLLTKDMYMRHKSTFR